MLSNNVPPLAKKSPEFIIIQMIYFGISTTLTNDRTVYDSINAAGTSYFKWLEIRCRTDHFDFESPQEIEKVKAELQKNKLKVSSLHPPGWVDIASEDEWTRMKSVREVEKVILVANKLSAERVIIHPGKDKGKMPESIKSLQEIIPFAREWDVKPILENTFPGYFGSRVENLHELSDKMNLEVCIDTSHAAARGDRIKDFLDSYGNKITHFHISDSKMRGKDDHLIPGEGKIKWEIIEDFLPHFNGFIIYELMPSDNPEGTLKKLDKIKDRWRKKIAP